MALWRALPMALGLAVGGSAPLGRPRQRIAGSMRPPAPPPRAEAQRLLLAARMKTGSRQPGRCAPAGWVDCYTFGGDCPADENCKTDKCYEGKCAMGPRCKPYGQVCYKYAPHVCCTNECTGVTIKSECLRLLNLDDNAAAHKGIAVDRQCENIGYCALWPGMKAPPGPRVTPWAVPLDDLASKYYNMPAVTFEAGAHVLTDQFISLREGQTFEGIEPDSQEPGPVRDGGTFFFTEDSYVETKIWNKYTAGVNTYCAAPILRDGGGGAFYAVGKDCCNEEEGFTCGDPTKNDAKACVALAKENTMYNYAVQAMEAKGDLDAIRDGGKGITTDRPIFCRWVRDYVAEQKEKPQEDTLYVFKPLSPVTYCVAPIANDAGVPGEQQYWAVGTDCCSYDSDFHCDDAKVAGAHSGKGDTDATGKYFLAIKKGEIKFGWKTIDHPMFVHWSKETLVPGPGDASYKPEIKFGKGVKGVTNAR